MSSLSFSLGLQSYTPSSEGFGSSNHFTTACRGVPNERAIRSDVPMALASCGETALPICWNLFSGTYGERKPPIFVTRCQFVPPVLNMIPF